MMWHVLMCSLSQCRKLIDCMIIYYYIIELDVPRLLIHNHWLQVVFATGGRRHIN